MMSQLDTFPP